MSHKIGAKRRFCMTERAKLIISNEDVCKFYLHNIRVQKLYKLIYRFNTFFGRVSVAKKAYGSEIEGTKVSSANTPSAYCGEPLFYLN